MSHNQTHHIESADQYRGLFLRQVGRLYMARQGILCQLNRARYQMRTQTEIQVIMPATVNVFF